MCVCVIVCVYEYVIVCVYVCVWERESVSECVYVWERVYVSECMCVYVSDSVDLSVNSSSYYIYIYYIHTYIVGEIWKDSNYI